MNDPKLLQLKKELQSDPLDEFVSNWILDARPHLFESEADFCKAKISIARELDIDSHAVVFVGSACVGYSLSPDKVFRPFSDNSDIDIAIISGLHFEIAWNYLRGLGANRYHLSSDADKAITDNRKNKVFWGAIATDQFLQYILPFGPTWVKKLAGISKNYPFNNREVRVRLYRDSSSLVSYHQYGVKKVRDQLLLT